MVCTKILFIYLLILSSNLFATKLPKLVTKQSINKIRFISKDGKFTYFQNSKGELVLSTNFKNFTVLNSAPFTQYTLSSTSSRKYITVEENSSFHDKLDLRKSNTLYVMEFGKVLTQKIGFGVNPKLHLTDKWISYYSFTERKLYFISLEDTRVKTIIDIKDNFSPYLTPERVMLDDQSILYTTVDKLGHYYINIYDRAKNISKKFYKSEIPGTKIELCLSEVLAIGQFGIYDVESGSQIWLLNPKDLIKFKKIEPIYMSKSNDLGNIHCIDNESAILFIKNIQNKSFPMHHSEVAYLSNKIKKPKILSDLKYITQLIYLDGRYVSPLEESYYIVRGKTLKHEKFSLPGENTKAKK